MVRNKQKQKQEQQKQQKKLDNTVEKNLEALSERCEFDTLNDLPISRLKEEKQTVEQEFDDAVDKRASSAVRRKNNRYQKEAMRNLDRAIQLKESTRNKFFIISLLVVVLITGFVVFVRNSFVEGIIATVIGSLVSLLFRELFLKKV